MVTVRSAWARGVADLADVDGSRSSPPRARSQRGKRRRPLPPSLKGGAPSAPHREATMEGEHRGQRETNPNSRLNAAIRAARRPRRPLLSACPRWP